MYSKVITTWHFSLCSVPAKIVCCCSSLHCSTSCSKLLVLIQQRHNVRVCVFINGGLVRSAESLLLLRLFESSFKQQSDFPPNLAMNWHLFDVSLTHTDAYLLAGKVLNIGSIVEKSIWRYSKCLWLKLKCKIHCRWLSKRLNQRSVIQEYRFKSLSSKKILPDIYITRDWIMNKEL